MASNNFSLIFSLLIIGAVLCSTTTVVVGIPTGPPHMDKHYATSVPPGPPQMGGAPFPPIHNPVGTPAPQLNKVAGRRGLLSVPGASPNTDSLASPYNNLVQVPTPPSPKSPNSPAHGSPKGGIPTPPSPKSPNSQAHGSPKGVPGASPNTDSLASPYNNLVQVPTPSSPKSPNSPAHGSPKAGIPTPPSPKSPNSPAHGSPKGVPGASPNTNSLASPYNNLVEVPATPSKSPVHGSPKGAPPRA